MERRFVGGTGMRVSKLAFGTMTFGDGDDGVARAVFRRCIEAGVDLFDTADVYNGGRSEELLGSFVAELGPGGRERLVLATKAYFPTGSGPNDRGSSRRHLVASVERSLARLRTDRVELFYLHRFDDATDLEQTLRAVEHLVQRGLVLYPAVSNFAAWQIAKALGMQAALGFSRFVAVQPMYNLLKRQAEVEILPMASSERLGVFPYSPVAGGLLSGKYGTSMRPASGRILDWEIYRARYEGDATFAVADRFCALAAEVGVHPVTLAVAWAAGHPAVTAPLLGARTVEQLEPALAAAEWTLDPEVRARVAALVPTPPPATDRSEEGVVPSRLGAR